MSWTNIWWQNCTNHQTDNGSPKVTHNKVYDVKSVKTESWDINNT